MQPHITNTISIQATADKVWDTLTNPSKTKQYMFGCEALSEWKVGSELLWQGHYEGQDVIFVKGHVLSFEPDKKLAYTVFDPHTAMEDKPENYLTVTYLLEKNNESTIFTVTQGDYTKVAEGERRYAESYSNGEGWNPILMEIKKVAENN